MYAGWIIAAFLFIIFLIWFLLGAIFYITSGTKAFLGVGVLFLLVGLANKAQWKEPKPLTPGRRNVKIVLVIGSIFLVLLSFAFWLLR